MFDMKLYIPVFLLIIISLDYSAVVLAENTHSYTVMQQDLTEIKSDFNDAVDQVRLLFIVGPT
jgi:hypothetical protein